MSLKTPGTNGGDDVQEQSATGRRKIVHPKRALPDSPFTKTRNALSVLQAGGIAEGMSEEEEQRRITILMGEGFLRAGKLDDAREAYATAGAEIPAEKLITLGDGYKEKGQFDRALEVYVEAGAVEKLIALGNGFMQGGSAWALVAYEAAWKTYVAAEVKISAEKLVALGDGYKNYDRFNNAWEVYEAAKAAEKLVSLGDTILQRGYRDDAQKAYAAAVRLGVEAG